MNKLQILE